MIEVEAILNACPLTPITMDPNDEEPLTPNHFLFGKSKVIQTPGEFSQKDCYQRSWRQVQYLTDQFWKCWSKEYLPTLLPRKKWHSKHQNLAVGDMVLLADDGVPRGQWIMGRVTEIFADKNGLVRQVMVKTKTGILKRPVVKLCFICNDTN